MSILGENQKPPGSGPANWLYKSSGFEPDEFRDPLQPQLFHDSITRSTSAHAKVSHTLQNQMNGTT